MDEAAICYQYSLIWFQLSPKSASGHQHKQEAEKPSSLVGGLGKGPNAQREK